MGAFGRRPGTVRCLRRLRFAPGPGRPVEQVDRLHDRLTEERLDPLDDERLRARALLIKLDRSAGDPGDVGEGPQGEAPLVAQLAETGAVDLGERASGARV